MHDLDTRLRHLHLSGMAQALAARNQEAVTNRLAYVDFLALLIEDELTVRRDRLYARRIKQATLPPMKTLENFDFSFNPTIPKKTIFDLATSRFIHDHSGVLFVGPPGVGKSHICIALAYAAVLNGYTVSFRSAFDLAEDMAEAAATGTRKKLVHKLSRIDLLCVDDLGMRKLPTTAAEDLLEVITRRYETGATIITSNRPLEDWGHVLGDTAAAGAILDRFLHHATILKIAGNSYRMHERQHRPSRQHQPETIPAYNQPATNGGF